MLRRNRRFLGVRVHQTVTLSEIEEFRGTSFKVMQRNPSSSLRSPEDDAVRFFSLQTLADSSIGPRFFTPWELRGRYPGIFEDPRLANKRASFSMMRRNFLIGSSQKIFSSRVVFTLFGEQTQLATMWIFMLTMNGRRSSRPSISCASKSKSRRDNLTIAWRILVSTAAIGRLSWWICGFNSWCRRARGRI